MAAKGPAARDKRKAEHVLAQMRVWRAWHRERLEKALNGVHRDVFARLMRQLKELRSVRQLVNFISAQDWGAVDADTRAIALHQINVAITALRESNGLLPFDDALPGARPNTFEIVRKIITGFPQHCAEATSKLDQIVS